MRRRHYLLAFAVFALNALICWPLFQVKYLDDMQSNEGAFISMGRFIVEHWPHVLWMPWFNGGTPIESAYLPLIPAATAAVAALTGLDPARAFHVTAALAYSAGPPLLFLFAKVVSGLTKPSLIAALVWSLLSPVALLRAYRIDDGPAWSLHRLRTIVFYGETPHNVALTLLPLAWLLIVRYWRKPEALRFALAAIVIALVMLSNAFGAAVATVSVFVLWLTVGPRRWRGLASSLSLLLVAGLLSCAFLEPSLLIKMVRSSQTLGGDYRDSWGILVLPIILAGLWILMRGVEGPLVRFAGVFLGFFGIVAALAVAAKVALVPSPHRYALEAEMGGCLAAGVWLGRLWDLASLPVKLSLIGLLAALAAADCRAARRLIRPANITDAAVYKESAWIKEHFPGARVFASGDTAFWLNLFSDNPQLAGGHEAAANWEERVAAYTIYTGQNAGERDGEISVLWLKAFACSAITVPGPASRDYFHPVAHPEKFAGLLPLVWSDGGDYIYAVPRRSDSLAHIVPAAAVVAAPPENGLDVAGVRRYVAALDEPGLPVPSLQWDNPAEGKVGATIPRGSVLSIQISYDPGWSAWVSGQPVDVRSDGLGMLVIDPKREGDVVVDLKFTGGAERRLCWLISLLTACILAGFVALGRARTVQRTSAAF